MTPRESLAAKSKTLPRIAAALSLSLTLIGCSTSRTLKSITITPSAGSQVLGAAGQTAQYHALGTYVNSVNGYTVAEDMTKQVVWSSLNTQVATVSASGIVTAMGVGTAQIQALTDGSDNALSALSDVSVAGGGNTAQGALTSISIIPGSQSVASASESSQFLAIGNYSGTPATVDMTSLVTWASSDTGVGRISSGGLTMGLGPGSTTITASATSATGAAIVATADFSVGSGTPIGLPVVTVEMVGANAAKGNVTGSYFGPAGTNLTPINCGPKGSGGSCSATVPAGTVVQFHTSRSITPQFGGWSSNCTPGVPGAAVVDPYSCYITTTAGAASSNVAVGAIFN